MIVQYLSKGSKSMVKKKEKDGPEKRGSLLDTEYRESRKNWGK